MMPDAVVDIGCRHLGSTTVLFDRKHFANPPAELFDPAYWRARDQLRPVAGGRGNTWLVNAGAQRAVLRHYRRGGWLASLLRDRYLWAGLRRSRPWREWHLLADLYQLGLPVPRPLAARIQRYSSLAYRGDLVTAYVPARALAEVLRDAPLPAAFWRAVGACVRRFHDAGLCHADLNAHNVLLNERGNVWLVDFDRSGWRRRDGQWQQANLRRLRRSLDKQAVAGPLHFDEPAWQHLRQGYAGG